MLIICKFKMISTNPIVDMQIMAVKYLSIWVYLCS